MYKTIVEKTEMKAQEVIDDRELWVNPENYEIDRYERNMRIRLLQSTNNESLNLNNLIKNGLKGDPQGPMKIRDLELKKYIETCFGEEEYTDINNNNFNYKREVISIPA